MKIETSYTRSAKTVFLLLFIALASYQVFENKSYIIAFFSLSGSEKAAFVKSAQYRQSVTPAVNIAKSCINHYASVNPIVDAEREARRPSPRFLFDEFDGFVPELYGVGLHCGPTGPDLSTHARWQRLVEFGSTPGYTCCANIAVVKECGAAALNYASVFNKHLAVLRADALFLACNDKQLP